MNKHIGWRMNKYVVRWLLLSIAGGLSFLWAIGPGYEKIDSDHFLPIIGVSQACLMIGSFMTTLAGYIISDKEMDQMMKEIADKDCSE